MCIRDRRAVDVLVLMESMNNREEMDALRNAYGWRPGQRPVALLDRISVAIQRGLARALRKFSQKCVQATSTSTMRELVDNRPGKFTPLPQNRRISFLNRAEEQDWTAFYRRCDRDRNDPTPRLPQNNEFEPSIPQEQHATEPRQELDSTSVMEIRLRLLYGLSLIHI